MKTISELTTRSIESVGRASREEKAEVLSCRMLLGNRNARHGVYEVEVFNFLFDNKDALGIQTIRRFTNLLVDGQIVLTDGRRLVVEIKLRMNWLKQCQSVWEFRQFLEITKEAKTNSVDGAIVVFEEFSGDWHRRSKKAKNLLGWEAWYQHSCNVVAGKRMDLVRLYNGEIEGYPEP